MNTAPAAVTATEDTTFDFDGGDTISVADPDVGTPVTVMLSVDHGVLNVTAGPGVTGNGTNTLTFAPDLPAAINTILASLTYQGDPDFNGNDTLTIVTSDGSLSDIDTVAITGSARRTTTPSRRRIWPTRRPKTHHWCWPCSATIPTSMARFRSQSRALTGTR